MDKIIYRKVRINANLQESFTMFTDNASVQTWLAEVADVEPSVGGKYELFWDADNKEINSTIGCKMTAFEKDRLLCFEWKGPAHFAQFMNTAEPLTHVSILFIPVHDGHDSTDIHLIHTGWRADENWEKARIWFEGVWTNALERLEAVFHEGK